MKSCYVSIPNKNWAIELSHELEKRDIKAVFPTDFQEFESSYLSNISSIIKSCDLTLCIADDEESLKSVLFEAGIAYGIGKKVLLVSSYESGHIPLNYSEFPIIRLNPSEYVEIANYVEEVLQFGKKPPSSKKKYNFVPSKPIGNYSEKLISELTSLEDLSLEGYDRSKSLRKFEKIIADAIIKSGVNIVSEHRSRQYRPDIAIWSDELTAIGATPLIIEIKGNLYSASTLDRSIKQLHRYLYDSNSNYGLLIYLHGPERHEFFYDLPPNIIAISAKELIYKLKDASFGEVVRNLRNQRVHGIGR